MADESMIGTLKEENARLSQENEILGLQLAREQEGKI
jgi:hypothetical protein